MFDFCSLGSGSSGNSAILKIGQYQILIDAGLSLRRIETHLAKLALPPEKIDLLFITHAHGDHSRAAADFALKYAKPVYLTKETFRCLLKKDPRLAECQTTFLARELNLQDVQIKIFRLPHMGHHPDGQDDAGGNVGFLFHYLKNPGTFKFTYFTDLGTLPEHLYEEIYNSDFYFIEANHDVKWQKVSRRPASVIKRNLSDFGHLSNEQSAKILTRLISADHRQRRTKLIMLAHLSKECNSHVLAEQTIRRELEKNNITGVEIKIAPEGALSERISHPLICR